MRTSTIALLMAVGSIPLNFGSVSLQTVRLAEGFDFPVGQKHNCEGYYKARGFRTRGHMGEDWNGAGGGNSDLGAPVYVAGTGVVVYARDARHGWGNLVIVRHAFRENGRIQYVDSLYGHVGRMYVTEGEAVVRGQKIATIGTGNGRYSAHLHFEVRKNLAIGTNQSGFRRDLNNYYVPTAFIAAHRSLSTGLRRTALVATTFSPDAANPQPSKGTIIAPERPVIQVAQKTSTKPAPTARIVKNVPAKPAPTVVLRPPAGEKTSARIAVTTKDVPATRKAITSAPRIASNATKKTAPAAASKTAAAMATAPKITANKTVAKAEPKVVTKPVKATATAEPIVLASAKTTDAPAIESVTAAAPAPPAIAFRTDRLALR